MSTEPRRFFKDQKFSYKASKEFFVDLFYQKNFFHLTDKSHFCFYHRRFSSKKCLRKDIRVAEATIDNATNK
jgi:hypothetical protein